MMSSNDSEGCAKVALILGAIASLIAIIVFLTGKENVPEFLDEQPQQEQNASIPTQYVEQPLNPIPPSNVPTQTSLPTFTPMPEPSPTSPPDTPPNSILEVVGEMGDIWWQGGVGIRPKVYIGSDRLNLQFILINRTPYLINVASVTPRVFDNMGREWSENWGVGNSGAVQPGDTFSWEGGRDVPLSDPNVTEIIILIENISRIQNARWRIRIYH